MVQFLCYVTFWKSFHSGSEKFYSDTDPAAAGAAAASAVCTLPSTSMGARSAPLELRRKYIQQKQQQLQQQQDLCLKKKNLTLNEKIFQKVT